MLIRVLLLLFASSSARRFHLQTTKNIFDVWTGIRLLLPTPFQHPPQTVCEPHLSTRALTVQDTRNNHISGREMVEWEAPGYNFIWWGPRWQSSDTELTRMSALYLSAASNSLNPESLHLRGRSRCHATASRLGRTDQSFNPTRAAGAVSQRLLICEPGGRLGPLNAAPGMGRRTLR